MRCTPFIAILVLVLAQVACDRDDDDDELVCTTMGCEGGFDLTIAQDEGAPTAEGQYFVIFDFGDNVLAGLDCDLEGGGVSCEWEDSNVLQSSVVNGQLVIRWIYPWGDAPIEQLTVRVLSDEIELGEQLFSPEWDAFYPNGEQCDEEPCYQAADTMIIDAPPA